MEFKGDPESARATAHRQEMRAASGLDQDLAPGERRLAGVTFCNSYVKLPANFYVRTDPTPVAKPRLITVNVGLARELGVNIEEIEVDSLAAIFSGNTILAGSEPIAMAYAGHQFGSFVPQLGDGRAILIGEVVDRHGQRRDLQLKGAGRTAFSRNGDGRAALGPVLREYLISEAMHALGIPATRALAAVTTGERVYREAPLPGAILTRVAASHVRVGTFQFFAARSEVDSLSRLAAYVIERHYPEAREAERPSLALLAGFAERQAQLIARWMHIGFVHGVMNTDNMTLSGETIDFGPCAFLDAYDPLAVFSAIDQFGRYAYANQPSIAQWNLARFAEAILPILDPNRTLAIELATEVVVDFPNRVQEHWLAGMRAKLGLMSTEQGDLELVEDLLAAMHRNEADFTLTFRTMCKAAGDRAADAAVRALFADPSAYDHWAATWRRRLDRERVEPARRVQAMRAVNPAVIPRNHRVEQALDAAIERGDLSSFGDLLAILARPYDEQPATADYTRPPRPEERVLQTFCGT